ILDEARLTEAALPCIINGLASTSGVWDFDHLCTLAAGLARRGFAEARRGLYAAFDSQSVKEDWAGGSQIIRLDGADGLLHVARRLGAQLRSGTHGDVDPYLMAVAGEVLGAGVPSQILEAAAASSLEIRSFLDATRRDGERFTTRVEAVPAMLAPD